MFSLSFEASFADDVATVTGDTALGIGIEALEDASLVSVLRVIQIDEDVGICGVESKPYVLALP